MRLDELIRHLLKCKKKYGNINVCVYNPYLDMPCESIVPEHKQDCKYKDVCEQEILRGECLLLI